MVAALVLWRCPGTCCRLYRGSQRFEFLLKRPTLLNSRYDPPEAHSTLAAARATVTVLLAAPFIQLAAEDTLPCRNIRFTHSIAPSRVWEPCRVVDVRHENRSNETEAWPGRCRVGSQAPQTRCKQTTNQSSRKGASEAPQQVSVYRRHGSSSSAWLVPGTSQPSSFMVV